MIHASAIAESIVAPTLFRPEFLHSLDPKRTFICTPGLTPEYRILGICVPS